MAEVLSRLPTGNPQHATEFLHHLFACDVQVMAPVMRGLAHNEEFALHVAAALDRMTPAAPPMEQQSEKAPSAGQADEALSGFVIGSPPAAEANDYGALVVPGAAT